MEEAELVGEMKRDGKVPQSACSNKLPGEGKNCIWTIRKEGKLLFHVIWPSLALRPHKKRTP